MMVNNSRAMVLIFFIFVALERLWATFFKNKALIKGKITKKWTLYSLTLIYAIILFSTITEYLLKVKKINYLVSILGGALFIIAFLLRNWAIKSLNKFHSINIEIRENHELIRSGMYKYLRHPYYLSIMLEVLSLPLITNSYFTFYFALLSYIPLVLIRAHYEERAMINKFGSEYLKYKSEVYAFSPFKKLKIKI